MIYSSTNKSTTSKQSSEISTKSIGQTSCSQYASYYSQVVNSLYYDQGDGEIFIAYVEEHKCNRMVTCVDISTLYPEKRGKSLILIETLARFKHQHLVPILKYWVVEDMLIFIETEVPLSVT